jgi:phosphopantetheine--protein transferase-like protein
MIHGIGIDIAECERFRARADASFLDQIFTGNEMPHREDPVMATAGFATKEAVIKALGHGLGRGSCWHDIEILGNPGDGVRVSGRLHDLRRAADRGQKYHVATAQTRDLSISFVLIEGLERTGPGKEDLP